MDFCNNSYLCVTRYCKQSHYFFVCWLNALFDFLRSNIQDYIQKTPHSGYKLFKQIEITASSAILFVRSTIDKCEQTSQMVDPAGTSMEWHACPLHNSHLALYFCQPNADGQLLHFASVQMTADHWRWHCQMYYFTLDLNVHVRVSLYMYALKSLI